MPLRQHKGDFLISHYILQYGKFRFKQVRYHRREGDSPQPVL